MPLHICLAGVWTEKGDLSWKIPLQGLSMTEFIIKVLLPSALSSDSGTQPEEHHSPIPVPHWQLRPPQRWCSALTMLSPGKGTSCWARCHTTEYEISMKNIIDRAVASTWFCLLWLDRQSHRDSSIVSNISCDARFQTSLLLPLNKASLSLSCCLATVD